jgi:hypothetical protein
VNLSDYNFEDIIDDLQVDSESYPDSKAGTGVALPLPGTYLVKAHGVDYKKKRDGGLVMWKEKYPIASIQVVEIVEPSEVARKVGVFHDVPTMPFERDGRMASQIADVLRSMDADAAVTGSGQVISQTMDRLKAGFEFRVRLDYRAYDSDFMKAELLKIQGLEKKEYYAKKNELEKRGSITGWSKIKKANEQNNKAELGFQKWAGPSGRVIDVRPTITAFISAATENLTLGPDKGLLKK